MTIYFAQINVSRAADGMNALLIIRGKMMALYKSFEKIVRQERFTRLAEALAAARRWELPRTSLVLQQRLEAMGGWEDPEGFWHDDTRPMKPIDDSSCTDIAAGWEV